MNEQDTNAAHAGGEEPVACKLPRGHSRWPEYQAWIDMRRRCEQPGYPAYKNYGARGIAVCCKWRRSFGAFLSDVGFRPSPAHSLDRIDNDAHYEPSNCRWATTGEQARNTRVAKLSAQDAEAIRCDGRPQAVIAAEYGVTQSLVSLVKAGKRHSVMSAARAAREEAASAD